MLLEFLTQVRVLHWQTSKYNNHIVFGDLYDSLSDSTDKLLEVAFGEGSPKRLTPDGDSTEIILYEIESLELDNFFFEYIATLNQVKSGIPSLTNIVDGMIDEINKTKYLLQLK